MLSILVFVDVIVKFNRNLSLKLSLLGVIVSTLIISICILYSNFYGYNIYLIETGRPFYVISLINFFWILYKGRLEKKIIVFEIFLILLIFSYLIFLDFNQKEQFFKGLIEFGRKKNQVGVIKVLLGLSISTIIPFILKKIIEEQITENVYFEQFKKWSYYLIFSLPTAFLIIVFFSNFNFDDIYSNISLSIAQFSILLFILFRPGFLNHGDSKKGFTAKFNVSTKKQVKNPLFSELFYGKLFFLNKNASAEELASLLSITVEDLHGYVIQHHKMSLVDLINKNRVQYFIEMLTKSKSIDDNLDTLSQKAGFTSRHHLLKPFKKFHGGTPSDFIRSISKN